MKISKFALPGFLLLFCTNFSFADAPKHLFTVEDMWNFKRVSDPVVSPDQKKVVYTVRTFSMSANKGNTDLWMMSVGGSNPQPLVQNEKSNDDSAVFSDDGKNIFFLSTQSGSSQVWKIPAAGGKASQVTSVPTDVNGFKLFPDGKKILLAAEIYPSVTTFEESNGLGNEITKRQGNYRRYDALLFRHWDGFEDDKRGHLFVYEKGQKPIDLMASMNVDAPTHPFGGMEEVAISPDGEQVIFAARSDGNKAAVTNNVDLFSVAASGKEKPINITIANLAWDNIPVFSPNGKTLAYLSMKRPGFESDQMNITLMNWNTKNSTFAAAAWDRSPSEMTWSRDGKTIYATADDLGNHSIFSIDIASGRVTALMNKGENDHPIEAGNQILFLKDTLKSPTEIWAMDKDGSNQKPLSVVNAKLTESIAWADYEQFSFPGHNGEKVFGYVMPPANWDGKTKAPVAFLIHGGPQGSFNNHFHYRWNPQVYAAQGYAVVTIDFHGSTGYGQKFTDSITGNWGGAPFDDLMKGLDYAIAKFPYLDSKKVFALGASYGGYMINWINGQTDRFKAMVAHDGIFDDRMGYFDTEELWFPEWEHRGTPWENPAAYQKYNPSLFVKNWKTPVLVIHGGKDYRVVDTQGMSAFTALQRKGIKSRLLYFPEQNHWVLKPQNSLVWHREVFEWLKEFQ